METIGQDDEVVLVREVLAREIETINFYQTLRGRAQTEAVRAFLAHITDEEKEHVAEAVEMIRAMDPVQARFLETGHVPRPALGVSTTSPTAKQAQAPDAGQGFTVGSLRGQR